MKILIALEGIVLSEMSDREKQILYELTYMWNLKTLNSKKQRVEGSWPRAWGVGEMGDVSQRVRTSK